MRAFACRARKCPPLASRALLPRLYADLWLMARGSDLKRLTNSSKLILPSWFVSASAKSWSITLGGTSAGTTLHHRRAGGCACVTVGGISSRASAGGERGISRRRGGRAAVPPPSCERALEFRHHDLELLAVDGAVGVLVEDVERTTQRVLRVRVDRPDGRAELLEGDRARVQHVRLLHDQRRLPLRRAERAHHPLELGELDRAVAVRVVPAGGA